MNNQGVYSPPVGSQGSASVGSPISTLSPSQYNEFISFNDTTYKVIGAPYLKILEQPIEKFRFRYKSEMVGTHGSLVGSSSNNTRSKNAPTVELCNFLDNAVIRCTLVTSDEGVPHPHRLVRRDGGLDCDDPFEVEVSEATGYVASFPGMAIIHTAKKNIRDELIQKLRKEMLEIKRRTNPNATLTIREEADIKANAECYQKSVNLNSVVLCFQAFTVNDKIKVPIGKPVYSNPVNNLKSALTGELKICRIDKYTSSVEGHEEVFIFVEKVGKKNIKIKFFELNDDDSEIWSAYGSFSELDVHHQYAIAFRTPPYKDFDITSPKEVFIQLERPSDGDCSEPIKFTYKPRDRIMGRKRQRMSYSGSSELSHTLLTSNSSKESVFDVSREISNELKKVPSLKDLDLSITDYSEYLLLLGQDNQLTADGPSSMQYQDDTMFARNILIEIAQCMKMELKNKKEHIQKLLKDRSTYGDSPLHAALRYGQREIVKYLLMLISTTEDCKTLINVQNSLGKTPLHYAVLQNQPEITNGLLMLGADPNRTDEYGFSPLHAAVRIPEAGVCVDALLSQNGIDIEARNDAGWTALHLAAEAGSYDAVYLLVRAGANVNNTDTSYGRTALHIAVEGGHKNIVEYLLKKTKISVNKRNFSGNTALHSAVVHTGARAKELCALLIRHGADPHIQNHNRESNDTDKQKESHVNIKVEVDSEDENAEETTGQSSFDLAMNKPNILQVLSGQTEELENEICSVSTKLELKDENLEPNWLSSEHKKRLSILLNKTRGWEKLARHLNLEYLLKTLEHNSNPSLVLLSCMEIEALLPLTELEMVLKEIGQKEAADYVNEISSIYS
ncbi:unnamed protein product [Xylocopa violacea]